MRFSNLLVPTSAEPPCGPDLDAAGDGDFFNYTISAESRLPERFVDAASGRVFDRTSINLEDEDSQLSALLDRSRDLRLAVLRAQFHAVAGSVKSFSDCLEVISALLSEFWADVHPQMIDGDMSFRKFALEALTDRVKVVMPLTYATIVRDRRVGPISLRSWHVAKKPESAYRDEAKLDAASISEVLAAPSNEVEAIASSVAIQTCLRALSAIRGRFQEEGDFESVPSFDTLQTVLNDMSALLKKNVPSLMEPATEAEEVAEAETTLSHAPAIASTPSLKKGFKTVAVGTHREARSALAALEVYFCDNEPSSPALILVHQAKLLIGRPLVEALAALAPGRYNSAVLHIDEKSGFSIDMDRMKELTVPISQDEGGSLLKRFSGQEVTVKDRQQAFDTMLGVESFVSVQEPSSPIPLLLSRARDLMDQNFSLILKEVFGNRNKIQQ